jgi:hypothetical protein
MREPEHAAGILNHVAQANRSPTRCHLLAEGREVVGVEVGGQSGLAEYSDDLASGLFVTAKCALQQFAEFHYGNGSVLGSKDMKGGGLYYGSIYPVSISARSSGDRAAVS